MTSIKIPAADELHARLSGLDRLLRATKWERAAIVFAYTQVGEVGRGRFHKPDPPRMHIRTFAEQGYAGLTTNKSVSRYRSAWVTAINNGWATPVAPGDIVELPSQDFPAWPYGNDLGDEDDPSTVTITDTNVTHMDERRSRGPSRPLEARVLAQIDEATKALARMAEVRVDELDESMRRELTDRLMALSQAITETVRAIRGSLVSV